jgi:CRP/FNR family transcriptional regulator, cyclic AMP receptor protein
MAQDQLIIDFEVLAQVAQETRDIKAGEAVFRTGDPGYQFFVIREGRIGIFVGERRVQTLGPKEMFGEMAIIDGGPRSASAIADEDSVIVPMSEQQFIALVQAAPHFALEVMRLLAKRLRAADWSLRGQDKTKG